MSGTKNKAEDGKPPAKVRKGERLGFDKTVAIHLYPEEYDVPTPSDKPEEASFNVIDDYRGSKRDKSNLRDVKIPKLEQLSNNAEAYCQLIIRLQNEKWSKEDPKARDVFLKARDMAHCIHPLAAPAYKAAVDALMKKIQDRNFDSEIEDGPVPQGYPWKVDDLVQTGLNGVQELLDQYGEQFADAALQSDDIDEAKGFLEMEYFDEIANLVFREPYRAYETQLNYLMHDIRKPYNVSFTDYKARVEQVFGYLPMFPAPSLRNKEPTQEDRIKRLQKIKPEVMREALYNSLPKTWRDEFERRETIDVREVSEPVFIDIMLRIEEEDNAFRAKAAASKGNNQTNGNSRGVKRAREGNNNNDGKKKRSHDETKKHKANKKCNKCKEAGRSRFAYTSHNDYIE